VKLPVFNDPVTGEPSLSATLVFVTFTVVMVKWALGSVSFWGRTLGSVTTTEIDAWLSPVFLLYFGRKATTATADTLTARAGVKPP
jgi:hypothetical protein